MKDFFESQILSQMSERKANDDVEEGQPDQYISSSENKENHMQSQLRQRAPDPLHVSLDLRQAGICCDMGFSVVEFAIYVYL